MRILVLQLARFGDIFITWPTLRALRRRYPAAEIHLIVRERFVSATEGLEGVDRVLTFDTGQVLAPLVAGDGDLSESLTFLHERVELLQEQDYDLVINLSFSPFSSYLVSLLSAKDAQVRGYTRQADGFLAIPDDSSAYFYAQVGVGRCNRYHLGEIFAAVADVELQSEDWRVPADWNVIERLKGWREEAPSLNEPYIVFHLGASQAEKTFPPFKWRRVLSELQRRWSGNFVLVGSANETALASEILDAGGFERVVNLVGRTDFPDLTAILQGASLLVGGDSAPMHLASFTDTTCLNLSFANVCFWETGPRAPESRVIFSATPEDLPTDRVVNEVLAVLEGRTSGWPTVRRVSSSLVGYEWRDLPDPAFEWRLIEAIYAGGEWPMVEDPLVARGLVQLREAVGVAANQITRLRDPQHRKVANALLEQVDSAIHSIGRIVPSLQPLVAWFETERLRIGPADLETLIARTGEVYGQLLGVLNIYLSTPEAVMEIAP